VSNRNNLRVKRAKIARIRRIKNNVVPFVPKEPRKAAESRVMAAAWLEIKKNVPEDTHPDIVKAFKRFFYAGARAILVDTFTRSDCLDESSQDLTETDFERLAGILDELEIFRADVAEGRQ
jgi:hypothetical protein